MMTTKQEQIISPDPLIDDQVQHHWTRLSEAGTLLGMRFLFWAYRCFGRAFFSAMMYPVALYFVACRPVARRASLQFLRQHWRCAPTRWRQRPHWGHAILHFKAFAEVILDKLLGWTVDINAEEFELADSAQVEALVADQRGQLIIGSHFGNLEYCRGFMQRYRDKTINILVYDKHAANFVALMQRQNPASRLNVFQVDEFDLNTLAILQEKVARGEWVFIAADRIPVKGNTRTVDVNFMGKKAAFPIGPYVLAKALGCPVTLMFAYRLDKSRGRKIYFETVPFEEQLALPRKTREVALQSYAQRFAYVLEKHALAAPLQWFNFYEFWRAAE